MSGLFGHVFDYLTPDSVSAEVIHSGVELRSGGSGLFRASTGEWGSGMHGLARHSAETLTQTPD